MRKPARAALIARRGRWLVLCLVAMGGAFFCTTAFYALRGAAYSRARDAISLMVLDGARESQPQKGLRSNGDSK